jgi:nicotinamidase-related amidase
MTLTRDVALDPAQSCLLFVDVQNFAVKRNGGDFAHLSGAIAALITRSPASTCRKARGTGR